MFRKGRRSRSCRKTGSELDVYKRQIWEGVTFCGYPVKTYLRERLIYDNGTFIGKPGMGKYIKREPHVKKEPAGEEHISRG